VEEDAMLGQSRWLLRGVAALETMVEMGGGGLRFVLQDDREAFSATA
jgi:hypothetical protein